MGFGAPDIPKPPPPPKPVVTLDDNRVEAAADAERNRAARRRSTADTILTGALGRQPGGLAQAYRKTVGGG